MSIIGGEKGFVKKKREILLKKDVENVRLCLSAGKKSLSYRGLVHKFIYSFKRSCRTDLFICSKGLAAKGSIDILHKKCLES